MTPEEIADSVCERTAIHKGSIAWVRIVAAARQARAEALEEAIGAAEKERLRALAGLEQGQAFTESEWINKGRVSAAEAIIAAINGDAE